MAVDTWWALEGVTRPGANDVVRVKAKNERAYGVSSVSGRPEQLKNGGALPECRGGSAGAPRGLQGLRGGLQLFSGCWRLGFKGAPPHELTSFKKWNQLGVSGSGGCREGGGWGTQGVRRR